MAAPLTDRLGPVALIGLGNIGVAVAERLLDAGVELHGHNRTPGRDEELASRGAARLDTPGDALEVADVCLLSLADDGAVEAVALGDDGVLAGARPSTVLVDTSTISVAASTRVAEAASERAVGYLRAPFSGNPTALRAGNAVMFVSGPPHVVARCDPLLHAITPTVHEVGDGEQARVLKLALQIMIGGTAALLAEAVVLGESAGLERSTLLEVVNQSVVRSPFVEYKSEPLLRDDFTATFTTAMMRKDVDLVLDLARSANVELPVSEELRSLLDAACDDGHADQDFMSLVLELKERSGARTPTRNR